MRLKPPDSRQTGTRTSPLRSARVQAIVRQWPSSFADTARRSPASFGNSCARNLTLRISFRILSCAWSRACHDGVPSNRSRIGSCASRQTRVAITFAGAPSDDAGWLNPKQTPSMRMTLLRPLRRPTPNPIPQRERPQMKSRNCSKGCRQMTEPFSPCTIFRDGDWPRSRATSAGLTPQRNSGPGAHGDAFAIF